MDLNNLSANLTNIANTLAEKPSIATLATVLFSSTGFQDWVKLFLIGGIFETCRRTASRAWHNIVDSIWITVDFEEGDDSYGGYSLLPPDRRDARRSLPRCRSCQALIMFHFCRLDDGLAFAASSTGQGEAACRQHLGVWIGISCGLLWQPEVHKPEGPLHRCVRLLVRFLAQTAVYQGDEIKG